MQKEIANDNDLNMKKLLADRVDLIVIDKFVAQHIMKTSLPQGADVLEALEPPLADNPIHLIFSKNAKAMSARFKILIVACKP